jgi:ABC-type polysaccharide/polyol phosphate export permease
MSNMIKVRHSATSVHRVLWLLCNSGCGRYDPTAFMCSTLPLLVLQMALLGLGFGILISSLTTKYRDLGNLLVTFGVQLWMYATPSGLSSIAGARKTTASLYHLNPMADVITNFRAITMGVGKMDGLDMFVSWARLQLCFFSVSLSLRESKKALWIQCSRVYFSATQLNKCLQSSK